MSLWEGLCLWVVDISSFHPSIQETLQPLGLPWYLELWEAEQGTHCQCHPGSQTAADSNSVAPVSIKTTEKLLDLQV